MQLQIHAKRRTRRIAGPVGGKRSEVASATLRRAHAVRAVTVVRLEFTLAGLMAERPFIVPIPGTTEPHEFRADLTGVRAPDPVPTGQGRIYISRLFLPVLLAGLHQTVPLANTVCPAYRKKT